MGMIDYRVYLVTDDPSRYAGDWLENVAAAVEGGVTCVQYRDTENDARTQFARIRRLQDVLKARRIPLIVNNDAELAKAVGAEGVHVGQDDMPPEQVRAIVGPNVEIGLSIRNDADVQRFIATQTRVVDCLGIGPVFDARKTKVDAADAMGPAGLKQIVARVPDVPNCAIGGITLENAAAVVSAGAKGLAVVSAFSKAADPAAVARAFRRLFA